MDGEHGGILLGWLIDAAAASIAGAAAAASLWLLGEPLPGLFCGAGVLLVSFSLLRAVEPGRQRYRLTPFTVPAWEGLLTDEASEVPGSSNVVRLPVGRRTRSHGERERPVAGPNPASEEDNVVLLSPDASAALHAALAELKRALN